MTSVGIVGSGPAGQLPDLLLYTDEIDYWIGADSGALLLMDHQISGDYAVGDFDSVTEKEKKQIRLLFTHMEEYPREKDETDLELALQQAYAMESDTIYLFGVTGGRLDHEIINIQLLYRMMREGIRGVLVDAYNQLELTAPGTHTITREERFPYISFIPFTPHVKGLSLTGFQYPLVNKDITWGSTLCISNKLLSNNGTFSYEEGILLLIKSRDI
ncbi:thiamine diphosphokinase [Lentibacillus sediminis]|uniref:thiamine diphosphokinase n=1 Tax=Lentibacillus sediminis TaxID=1940529 RepID=UPI000C1C102C|nr:thiamine diphosphokinase [Lentibacillus sediminis]